MECLSIWTRGRRLGARCRDSAAGDTMCETYGNYCVGSVDLNLYTAVAERKSRPQPHRHARGVQPLGYSWF